MLSNINLEQRLLGIGGSDMPIILGLSSYKTSYELYLEKTGLKEIDTQITPVQYWGTKIEPLLREEFEKRNNVKVSQPDQLIHPFYDYIRANVDGFIDEWNSVLEIKCSHAFMASEWGEDGSDVIPMSYLVQVAHYCGVMNASTAHIAVLIGGNDYREFKYTRDLELENTLLKAATEFWHYVETKSAPPLQNIEDFNIAYKQSKPITIIANDKALSAFKRYKRYSEHAKKIKDLQESYKFSIAEYMKDADCLVDSDGNTLVTYKSSKSGSRRFLIKG